MKSNNKAIYSQQKTLGQFIQRSNKLKTVSYVFLDIIFAMVKKYYLPKIILQLLLLLDAGSDNLLITNNKLIKN